MPLAPAGCPVVRESAERWPGQTCFDTWVYSSSLSFFAAPLSKSSPARLDRRLNGRKQDDMFSLDHRRLPLFQERNVLLLLPVRLRHEVRKSAECTETGQTPLPHSDAVAPETIKTIRIPSVTEGERKLRGFETKRKKAHVRRQIDALQAEKRRLEEQERKLREELKLLGEDGEK